MQLSWTQTNIDIDSLMWLYENKEFTLSPDDLEDFQGFVYCITEIDTGKKYIGKKFFWKPKILPVTKTRKRRKRTRVPSDWPKRMARLAHRTNHDV